MTVRRSRRRRSRTACRCVRRRSSRASTSAPCSARPSGRCRCHDEGCPVTITGRVPLLLLLGVVAVVLRPEFSTVWLWLFVVLLLVAADLLLATATRDVVVE